VTTVKGSIVAALLLALVAFGCADRAATGQTGRNPFAIAGGEAAGAATGLAGAILAWQNKFHIELQTAAKALKTSGSAFWTLAGASFAYGVFHAAGPGHGKAVLASYMIASETALRRGMILAALAALLQGCVAIVLVGAAAAILGATATQMKSAANSIELASYGAIALLGAGLVWKKGWAFLAAARAPPEIAASRGGFYCEAVNDPSHVHSANCGHLHAVDPTTLERDFSWSGALGAVVAAGLRPCSGAILILVFTLAQGMFWAGASAVLLMSAGTAVTTGLLAACAVFARQTARRWSGPGRRWTSLAGRGAELLAAALVMGLGLALLVGARLNAGV
jgi:ABC-type nickel/cobalt efflux system permease component RcnA